MYKILIRPLLFLFDPESVHHFTFNALRWLSAIPGVGLLFRSLYNLENPALEREVFGIKFKNPVGLAAGFDKDAKLVGQLANMGFGFIEIGTLTPKPQAGNEKPRLFRLKADGAIINRMGFNNMGVVEAVTRLKKENQKVIIGGNIGKNKVTPNEEAYKDYEYCFEALYDVVDYFVVNVSSPNTPNLRALQEKEPLKKLLSRLKERAKSKKVQKPILLKIAPDLTNLQLDDIVEIVQEAGIEGVIATNTTISREGLKTPSVKIEAIGNGGVSGKLLARRSTEVIKYLRQNLPENIKIIGVGGIFTAEDAKEKLAAGASLVQVYTGFIYEGPRLIKNINKALLQ